MSDVIYYKNKCKSCKNITWSDVIYKISEDIDKKSYGLILKNKENFPSIITSNQTFPKSISNTISEVKNNFSVGNLHIYISFSKKCDTFERHKDNTDVLIVQAIGKISYEIDDNLIYHLNPGDCLYIKSNIFHRPILYEPRATLSFTFNAVLS